MDIKDIEFFEYVNNLKNTELLDMFSTKWFEYHKNVVLINVYLHNNNELIDVVGNDKMSHILAKFEVLLRELITTYFIRFLNFEEKIKKNNKKKLQINELTNKNIDKETSCDTENSHNHIYDYISLYHEMAVLNIFELILLSDHIYEQIDTYIINLFAYIYSNLVSFLKTSSDEYFVKPITELPISEILNEENDKTHNIDRLKIYINVINTLRNIIDRIHLLNNTVVNKIVDYDILLILIPLIEKKPWKHDDYIFEQNEWIKNDDNAMATVEKQLWIILYTLILNSICQEKYEMTNYRRNNILKLRKYMNENLYEQLPPMKTLHTFIEHLYISKSVFPENKNSYLIIDVVPEIFDEIKNDILKNKKKVLSMLNNITISKEVLGSISEVYLSVYEFDHQIKTSKKKTKEINPIDTNRVEKEKPVDNQYTCNNCKEMAELQCSQCKQTYYCSKECQMKDWFNHREVCSSYT
ncbi:MYND finger protein, putative [Plasmodium berghei]|uniref:MYND-type zinc finger protein, putative n=2 Tax=Plasmodium berghei TaxID=5821 RepID=A0A509ACV0_PLABA|nr:MYND-type zinc finger protein, putative [Plasmodium berghei ANKA]CXH81174.1 MYND finger protein, putative [Plasmodium berghei]SCM19100.1 MYND finger protein, putative [Plasmodium berghei]SCN21600.1 MYND finger protein, putative [Plasmodium berghei]SCO58833.1 MYND finger protein, putative [Plasmodium berghei]SCO58888.1 MYND finger protein, putative [Plasmodium berghei]|eukprot:XP_034419656.1 MYND-type zinc finger protein, putative [Plasmodium berghei ANKA]